MDCLKVAMPFQVIVSSPACVLMIQEMCLRHIKQCGRPRRIRQAVYEAIFVDALSQNPTKELLAIMLAPVACWFFLQNLVVSACHDHRNLRHGARGGSDALHCGPLRDRQRLRRHGFKWRRAGLLPRRPASAHPMKGHLPFPRAPRSRSGGGRLCWREE